MCDRMHIIVIRFFNTVSQHIIFSTGSIIKNLKLNNIKNVINQVNKLYLQLVFIITNIHYDSEFVPLQS